MGSKSSSRAKSARLGAFVGSALTLMALAFTVTAAEAKTPGHKYCFSGTCHRVQSIAETERMIGSEMLMQASFYDDCKRDGLNPCGLTSSGEQFRPDQPDNAASPVFPDGTMLLLFNPYSRGAAVVRVNNAGPYWGKRKLDVSRAAAEKLGFRTSGVADLKVRVIRAPTKAEATYKKNRRYASVPGYLGQYDDAVAAHRGFAALLAIEAMAGSLLAPVVAPMLASRRGDNIGQLVENAIEHSNEPVVRGRHKARPQTAALQRNSGFGAEGGHIAGKRAGNGELSKRHASHHVVSKRRTRKLTGGISTTRRHERKAHSVIDAAHRQVVPSRGQQAKGGQLIKAGFRK